MTNPIIKTTWRSVVTKKQSAPLDPATLIVCNDPLPNHRKHPDNKYKALFSNMKVGQALKCQPSDVSRVSNALRKWVEVTPIKGAVVRSIRDYGDGMGRVWMVKP
jgi:hypothetical protein